MKVSELAQTGDEYKGVYWDELEALYRGGERLLRGYQISNSRAAGVLTRILPKGTSEKLEVYEKRLQRAVYLNYSGSILNYLVASLQQDPLRLETMDEWFTAWTEDVTNGRSINRESISSFMAKQALDWLIYGISWTLCDIPKIDPTEQPKSVAEQDAIGMREAYALRYCPDSVIDWEIKDGKLIYAKIYNTYKRRAMAQGEVAGVVREWTIYTNSQWQRWEHVAIGDKNEQDPSATMVGSGNLTAMPLVMCKVDGPLWLMDALRSPAGEHLRKSTNIAWLEANTLIQDLWEFIDQGNVVPSIGDGVEDTGSARTDNYGPGWVHTRKAGDRVEYIAPKTEIYRYALESIKEMREEIYRVCYAQSLALGNTGAAMSRSEGSRSIDKEAERVIVGELGKYAKAHAKNIANTIAAIRGDVSLVGSFEIFGFEEFSSSDDRSIVDIAEVVTRLAIPSKTFKGLMALRVVKVMLGPDATDDNMAAIISEIDENISAHSLEPGGVEKMVVPFADDSETTDEAEDDEPGDE